MLQKIVSDTLEFYFSKMKKPRIEDISSMPEEILQKKGCAFVTLYLDGEVHGSAGNIKEIENSLGEEIISSTIDALSSDKRFPPLTLQQFEKIRFRVDIIEKREMLMF